MNGEYPFVTMVTDVFALTVIVKDEAKGYSNGVTGKPERRGVVRAFDPAPDWSKDPTTNERPICDW